MKIDARQEDKWLIFKVEGDVSHDDSNEFSEELLRRIDDGAVFVRVDMKGCEFICSSGLGAVAAALMIVRSRGGDMQILNAGNNVYNLFRTTKLNTIIKINKNKD